MRLMNTREVASQISRSVKYVRKLILTGQLRGVKQGREYFVDADALEIYVNRRMIS
jgi:excisionase family DNA binding protein